MIMRKLHNKPGGKPNGKQGGFTLLEMIVSIGIFMVVAVVAVGALVRITSVNRQAQSIQTSMTNLSFALESMSREIRMGANINCNGVGMPFSGSILSPSSCSGSAVPTTILFQSQYADTTNVTCRLIYGYQFTSNGDGTYSLSKAQQSSCGQALQASDFSPILDSNVKLTSFETNVKTYSGGAGYDWVFIRLQGYTGVKQQEKSNFDIQTGISQRISD